MLANVFRSTNGARVWAFDAFCVISASLLLALLAQVELRLWFTPVPITLQPFGIMLIAATLGSKRGALALIAYLGEGALGLPVFAGGAGGLAVFAGPTAGYLFGFVPAAFIMGFLLEKGWKENFLKSLAALSLGSLVILTMGTLWLTGLFGFSSALALGFYPFLMGSALKSMTAASIISAGSKAIKRFV